MGETGCGKTRLIKFMCDLWKPPGAEVRNMILMKVRYELCLLSVVHYAFSALTLLVGRQEGHPAC